VLLRTWPLWASRARARAGESWENVMYVLILKRPSHQVCQSHQYSLQFLWLTT